MKKLLTISALALLLLGAVSVANATIPHYLFYSGTSDIWGDFEICFNGWLQTFEGTWYYSAAHNGDIEGEGVWDNMTYWVVTDGTWDDDVGSWGGSLDGTFYAVDPPGTCYGNVYNRGVTPPDTGTFSGTLDYIQW